MSDLWLANLAVNHALLHIGESVSRVVFLSQDLCVSEPVKIVVKSFEHTEVEYEKTQVRRKA